MEQMGLRRPSADEASLAQKIVKARDALGAEAFFAAEAAGRAWSYDEAMNEVHEWLEISA
jgi:hypothetical protein